MCLIIDANVANEMASQPPTQDAAPVIRWITEKKGKVAVGGRLSDELHRTSIRRLMLELRRSGTAIQYSNELLENVEQQIVEMNLCISNDTHIIALAKVSGSRLLYTRDENLQKDFKKKSVLDVPRGKIYSSHTHTRLLNDCPSCRDP